MINKEKLGRRLKQIRQQLNMTADEVAQFTGCSKMTILAYERGTRCPKIDRMKSLAQLYNMDVEELFFSEDED